jgi:autotransporter strand-loop-strand O-heptosyltransferase
MDVNQTGTAGAAGVSIWAPGVAGIAGGPGGSVSLTNRTAEYILRVDPTEEPPRLAPPDESRPVAEPDVCIGVQGSTLCKTWNNRVVCIDKSPINGAGTTWTHIPHGAENETGDRRLIERVRWLRHAKFFIGLPSGLSWLAAGTPVALISGSTHPTNEFTTPYRVINWHACNSCWNDVRERFDHKIFLWCPRHAGTPWQFECTRLIAAEQVKQTVRTIPEFGVPRHQRHPGNFPDIVRSLP